MLFPDGPSYRVDVYLSVYTIYAVGYYLANTAVWMFIFIKDLNIQEQAHDL